MSRDENPNIYSFLWTRANDTDFLLEMDSGVLELPVISVDQEDTYYCSPENIAGKGDPAIMRLIVISE